ncbi:MAG TPA: hypothetical protein VGE01_11885 [Fimbriimonas sp.]
MPDEIRRDNELENDDSIQHGIDDDPNNDPEKARNIGGVGGAVTGLAAGSMAGPVGAAIGAVVGGVAGALGSQAAVNEVDKHDNDNTVTGIGHGATRDAEDAIDVDMPGNRQPGIQTGGHAVDGTPDTRGISEKTADALTGDKYDDKTGKYVGGPDVVPGNDVPGIQTGGLNDDGSPDTRGITEKTADALTGDKIDDKTGKRI